MKLISFFVLFIFILASQSVITDDRNIVRGGLQGDRQIILTPDKTLNEKIQQDGLQSLDMFGFDPSKSPLVFAPKVTRDIRWIAGFNLNHDSETFNVNIYDGWMFTTATIHTNMRLRRFQRDVTGMIKSNAYHMAVQREYVVENEIVMIVVSPKKQTVVLEFDEELLGQARTLLYEMDELEAKFIHIVIPPDEYTVVTWRPEDVTRRAISLNEHWRFHKGSSPGAEQSNYNDSGWERISIPHTWNAKDIYDTRNIHDGLDIFEMYYRGDGWYRKSFNTKHDLDGNNFTIHFHAANQIADVWINDAYLGKHMGGYTGFSFDVTDYIKFDEDNLLAVRVNNSYDYDIPPHTADFIFYGGIYRDVELIVTDPVFVDNVIVRTPDVSHTNASVWTQTIVRNTSAQDKNIRLVTNIVNPYNEIVKSLVDEFTISAGNEFPIEQETDNLNNPLLWSPEEPYLYRVFTTIYDDQGNALDQNDFPLGFRWYEFDADKGFILNGEQMKLKGVNYHQDHLFKGNAISQDQMLENLVHIKNMGANFIRLAHYPHHHRTIELCDSLGLMLWQEIPFVNTVGREKFIEIAKNMLTEMIRRDINNPSVILWGVGNEYQRWFFPEEDIEYTMKITRELHNLAKELDPTRLTIQAHNHYEDPAILDITDVQGRNQYYGWYEDTYKDFSRRIDEEREKYPHWKVVISEYGAEGKFGFHVNDPKIFDHSETYQMNFHRAHWEAINERDWVAGSALWNMFDFGSFVKIGNIPRINQKGMMTKDRKNKKGVYYYYKSQWSDNPIVHIVCHTWKHRTGKRDETQPVTVLSNGDWVELYLNGEKVGKKSDNFIWDIMFKEGVNRLHAVGSFNGEIVHDNLTIHFQFVD